MRENWVAIVNRRAGAFRTRVAGILEQLECLVDKVAWTENAEHAAELAAGFHGYRGLVVVGGDGTIFQVIQAMDRSRQRLAIVPAGRGNSLARDLELPPILPALDLAKEPERIDLMEVAIKTAAGHERRCLAASTVAVGYPVAVAHRADRRFRFLGQHCYAAAAAVTRPAPFSASVLYDCVNHTEGQLTGVIINNTRHIANFAAFPHANCHDGFLESMQLRRGFLGQTLHNVSALGGWFSYQPSVPIVARNVRVEMDKPHLLLVDGDIYGTAISVEVQLIAGALACQRA